jgi:hypothetical protein
MKDYKLKQRNLRDSHTLGWSSNWNTFKDRDEVKSERFAKTKKKMSLDFQKWVQRIFSRSSLKSDRNFT